MITVQDLKNGTTFELNGEPFIVLKYEHIKLGRGTANIRVKIRSLKNGKVAERTFINSARVEEIQTSKKKMQYLYSDGKSFIFMDPASFEQVSISSEILGEASRFLKEGMEVQILFWGEKPLWAELPPKIEFVVAETVPGVKGNTASNVYKPATLENGYQVKIPLFINQGDKIRVDTRTGEYVERVKT
jgi:elongation factor P